MFHLQPRFGRRQGRRVQVTLQHRRFRAAFDLYLLRDVLGEADPAAIRFWTDIQNVGSRAEAGEEPAAPEADAEGNGEAPPRRRRRRSRWRGRSGRRAPEPAPAN
jgi:poly(A) polymerase